MKTFFFILIVALDLIAVFFRIDWLESIAKPIIIPSLFLFFSKSYHNLKWKSKYYILLALIFSWLGDCFLLLEKLNSSLFIFGLLSFLLAHIFYIIIFWKLYAMSKRSNTPWIFLVGAALYYIVLLYILIPEVETDLKIPVIVYGFVICFMFCAAAITQNSLRKADFIFLVLGAGLFILSDSLIALTKFIWTDVESVYAFSRLIIMGTYIAAQFLIVRSILRSKVLT